MWCAVLPIAYFWGWLASVVFVSACSIYANAASDFAAFRADRNPEITKKLDQIISLLEDDGKEPSSQPQSQRSR